MRKIYKSTLAIVAGAAMLAGAVAAPSKSLAWGDNGGGRRSYTLDQINRGVLGNNIVFNSISDSTIGNEKNFVGAREDTGKNEGVNNVWNGNDIKVENGKDYLVRLYVHNNNPNGTAAVSHNTRVAFDIPEISGKSIQVNGFIFSDNATPSRYWDYVNFTSDQNFHLEYVYGSALIENNGYASEINGGAKQLSDEIVTKALSNNGIRIGYEKEGDGEIPGCYTYASYITIKVKAVYDAAPQADYTISQKIRLAGTSGWPGSNVEAKVGDKVEIQVNYTNNGTTDHNNVMIRTILPQNLRYVPGSTKLYNENHNGATVNQDDIIAGGINIGSYSPKANAYVRFTAEVVDESLQVGSNTLVDWTQGGVGQTTIQDYVTVVVQKAAKADPQLYNVTISYVYADGSTAAETYHGAFASGDNFTVESPVISGYTADKPVINGTMAKSNLEYTVTYNKNKGDDPVVTTPEDPEDPVIPDPVTPTPKPTPQLPTTGPVAGSVIGLGALTTSAGYYIASRRALRK